MPRSLATLAFLVVALAPVSLSAQVTVRATALTELRVRANIQSQSIAAGTDITTGAHLAASHPDPISSAGFDFSITHASSPA